MRNLNQNPEIFHEYNHLSVSLGNVEEFVNIILTIINLSSEHDKTCILYIYSFWPDEPVVINDLCTNKKEHQIDLLLNIVYFSYKPVLKEKHLPDTTCFFEKKQAEECFPTARHRINAKNWLKQTLKKHSIDLKDTYELLDYP